MSHSNLISMFLKAYLQTMKQEGTKNIIENYYDNTKVEKAKQNKSFLKEYQSVLQRTIPLTLFKLVSSYPFGSYYEKTILF